MNRRTVEEAEMRRSGEADRAKRSPAAIPRHRCLARLRIGWPAEYFQSASRDNSNTHNSIAAVRHRLRRRARKHESTYFAPA